MSTMEKFAKCGARIVTHGRSMDELYQEIILEHAKNPRHFGWPAHAYRLLPTSLILENKLFYCINPHEKGWIITPMLGTEHDARYWKDAEIYGPFPLDEELIEWCNSQPS